MVRLSFLYIFLMFFNTFTKDSQADDSISSIYSINYTDNNSYFVKEFTPISSDTSTSISWNQAVNTCKTPKDICVFATNYIKYEEDKSTDDEWLNGKDTLKKGCGDCEDIAAFIKDICLENNLTADLYIIENPIEKKAHVVVIGTYNGNLWLASNGIYIQLGLLSDAKEYISREMRWWYDNITINKVAEPNKYILPSAHI